MSKMAIHKEEIYLSSIDIIKNKSLVDYIQGVYPDDNLDLQSDGTWRCVCPLHGGNNPTAFTVFPDNRFYCYSCFKHGSIIDYVMEREGKPFFASVEILADKYSIDLGNDDTYKKQKSIAQRNELKSREYEKSIDKVYDYLTKKRGLTDETIKHFRLGYCVSDGYHDKTLTIPMKSPSGVIVAFGYRYFDSEPKYKNSSNNELFQKGSYLFNMDNALRIVHKTKCLYVVEGHIDAISIHQMGEAAVAYCGITFSKEHVLLIKQYTQRIDGLTVIIVPDNDGKANKMVDRGRLLFDKYYPDANVKVAKIA